MTRQTFIFWVSNCNVLAFRIFKYFPVASTQRGGRRCQGNNEGARPKPVPDVGLQVAPLIGGFLLRQLLGSGHGVHQVEVGVAVHHAQAAAQLEQLFLFFFTITC